MSKLAELRQSLEAAKAEGNAILAKAEKEGRDLTETEEADVNAAADLVKELNASIVKEERALELRRALAPAATSRPAPAATQPARTVNEPDPARTHGFKDIAEFAVSTRRATVDHVVDDRLFYRPEGAAPSNVHIEQGGSSGEGFLVPPQFRDDIWTLVQSTPDLFSLAAPEPTAARQVKLAADETTPWGTTGVQAYWRSEAAQMTASKHVHKEVTVELNELYAFVNASEELLEDSPRMQARLTTSAARAISYTASDAVMWGNGVGKPLGFMEAASLVTVAKESGQAADTIDDQNILKMYARMLRTPGSRPIWIMNQDVLPQLAAITIGDQPQWNPAGGLSAAPMGTLMGLPILYAEHAKTLGDLGDIVLADLSGYYAVRRTAGANFASSMHLYFDYGVQSFRWTFRFGGRPYLSAAVSPDNGSNTKSHFVALAARA